MLTNLRIENFITIKTFDSEFFDGLSVFTGESGVGKSVIFSALYCILGKTFSTELIRPQCDYAELEAHFDISNNNLTFLRDFTEGEKTIIVYRKVSKTKKQIIKINSQSVTQKKLKEIGSHLATFINQHEQLSLLKPSFQLELIDKIDTKITQQREIYQGKYTSYLSKKNEIDSISKTLASPQHLEFFKFQLNDIEHHNFQKEEEYELKLKKKEILQQKKDNQHFQEISSGLDQSLTQLSHLNSLVKYLDSIDDITKSKFESLVEDISELSFKLSGLNKNFSQSDMSLDEIEMRLDLIFTYCNKYKKLNLNQLCEFQEELAESVKIGENSEELLYKLNNELKIIEQDLILESEKLTYLRKQQSKPIQIEIEETLHRLGFNDLKFKITFSEKEEFSQSGKDSIQFMIQINKGSDLKAIQDSASGGELSRILLAFYSAFSKQSEKKLFLFDEIDTGVGGISATSIGKELSKIAQNQQVFCITHLAQIANLAQHHLVVAKNNYENETITNINYLDKSDNIELIRMMGGETFLKEVNKT